MDATRFFAQTYGEARDKFLTAADAGGLDVETHLHPMRGRDGEELAMDVARVGPRDARALLVISSACHGAEGFCGSGVQGRCWRTTASTPRPPRPAWPCCTSTP
jgi:hypothetical protein